MNQVEKIFVGDVSKLYAALRPSPPPAFVEKTLLFLEGRRRPPFGRCVDVGCGTGLATQAFAPHFDETLGFDVSETQLEEARASNRFDSVSYHHGSSSRIAVDDASVDLVVSSAAAHWFDLPVFFVECHRVLRPGGVVALGCYQTGALVHCPTVPDVNGELNDAMRELDDVLRQGGYWPKEIDLINNQYRDMKLPYLEQAAYWDDPEFEMERETSVRNFILLLSTQSGFINYFKARPESGLLKDFERRILQIIPGSSLDTSLILTRPSFLVLTRKP